jgi:CPA2 family monovalent cation:H+ antiporter-2
VTSELSQVLTQLTIVLGAAMIAAVGFQAIRLPLVLGYLLAGLLIGPHVTGAVHDTSLVGTLSDLGVILLFYTIGLEFSVRTIARVGLPTLFTVVVELSLIAIVMFGAGRALGLTSLEAVFVALGVAIASTMLVVKGIEEHKVTGPAVELILAMMVVEDLLSILLLAIMTGVATGSGLSARELGLTLLELGGFLVAMVVAGLIVVPRTIRMVVKFKRSEPLLVTSLAICFAMVWAAVGAGYSIALGAFLGGMLIAESGKGKEVDELIRPFRDIFAAIFFISIGMTIDPAEIAQHWLAAILVAVVLVVGKTTGISIAAFLTGHGLRRSIQAGLSLSQIGEFSFIMVAVGIAAGVARPMLLPIVVGAAFITAITGSWQIRASGRFASWIDAHLPKPLAMFVSFYESWIQRLRASPRPDSIWRRIRRPVVMLVVDGAAVAAIVIGAAAGSDRIADWLEDQAGLDPRVSRVMIIVVAAAVATLFALGVARGAIRVARMLAAIMIPHAQPPGVPPPDGEAGDAYATIAPPANTLDLGRSPRRALVITLELAIVLAVGLPLAAITQPIVPGGGLLVFGVVAVLALVARRSITDFDRHVRAGSALIVEVLAKQGAQRDSSPRLAEVEAILPGFTGLTPIKLGDQAPAVGKSLAELDLRAKTGASVLAITRGDTGTANPSPREPLRGGDVLAVAGSAEAIASARELLLGS